MILSEYLTAIKRMIAVEAGEASIYTDALVTEGLRQALREYELSAPAVLVEAAAAGGQEQTVSSLAGLVELVSVAWPWDLHGAGLQLRDRIVRWHWTEPGKIWIEDGEPAAGDTILYGYRKAYAVKDLDLAATTTLPAEHERMLVVGSAGWTVELHYRQAAESLKGPTVEQVKRMYTWSYLRMQEFRNWLRDLGRASPAVRPVWRDIGL